MTPDGSVLRVLLHGRRIATLTNVGGDRTLLAFEDDYVADPMRATLGLAFKGVEGGVAWRAGPTQRVLPPFFSNLLPEGPMRRYLAARAGVGEAREFFLLWMLGRDLPGALVVEPADGDALPPASVADADARRPETALRFSLAGVQLKFSALANDRRGGGLVIPAEGVGGSWIVKLPSQVFPGVPENEFAVMALARAVGIDVPETRLVPLHAIEGLPGGLGALRGPALAVERFDRSDAGPVHIEDFAQVFGVFPERKYERASYRRIAAVLAAEAGADAIAEFVRRLVFGTLVGNADMHLKNWSLVYPDRRTPRLAPAYDLVSTIAYLPDGQAALKYSRTRDMSGFDRSELSHLAAKALAPEAIVLEAARETVARFREAWASEKGHLPLAPDVVAAIETHMRTIPLFHGR